MSTTVDSLFTASKFRGNKVLSLNNDAMFRHYSGDKNWFALRQMSGSFLASKFKEKGLSDNSDAKRIVLRHYSREIRNANLHL